MITLTNYNLAIVFESLMVARNRDICCTGIDNGRHSDCHRQNELQNDSINQLKGATSVPNFMKIERGPVFFLLIWYGMTQIHHTYRSLEGC